MNADFYSHGKLLITGEYAVLDGALSLAVPTKMGQSMQVSPLNDGVVQWTSFDVDGKPWFESSFYLDDLKQEVGRSPGMDVQDRLFFLLCQAHKLNPGFLDQGTGYSVRTQLEFPRQWGLGSSSTLINNIADWAEVDAYELHDRTFGGSGYDIACARHDQPILFQRLSGQPNVRVATFNPPFTEELFFVYLNRKQDSRKSIEGYRMHGAPGKAFIEGVSGLTSKFLRAQNMVEFNEYINLHEKLLSGRLGVPPIKQRLFPDYPGSIKSLGAWGGDFILASGKDVARAYFSEKGYQTILGYSEMVL